MTKEELEKMWTELDKIIIYQEKALNNGIFNSGRYYDFYQKKEAVSAEKFIIDNLGEQISKTTVIEIDCDRRTLYRLTVIFNKD